MITVPQGDEAVVALLLVLACVGLASLLRAIWGRFTRHDHPNTSPLGGEPSPQSSAGGTVGTIADVSAIGAAQQPAHTSAIDSSLDVTPTPAVRREGPARSGRVPKVLTVLVLVTVAGAGILFVAQPRTDPEAEKALAYYREARPIIDRQIAEFGRPFDEMYADSLPAVNRGDPAAWQRFIAETKRLQPYLANALRDLGGLSAASGRASDFHEKQVLTWRRQMDAMVALTEGWDAADFERVEAGLDALKQSRALRQENDLAQAEFISWLGANARR